jgi:tyrosinase
LQQNLASIQQRLYNLFSNYGNYTMFSNEVWMPDPTNTSYDSLESLHDTIHNIAGGGSGHMAYIPFSAFDPIFFLHHANVDRIFAMWQALYPNSWITPSPAVQASYTTSAGEIQDSKTALTPFYAKTDGTFWNSDMIRDPKVLGYSYAEVAGVSLQGGKADKKAQSRVRAAINKLYGAPSPASLAMTWKEEMGAVPGIRIPGASLISNGRYREWIANIRVDKQALHGPFLIHLFLDDMPSDSATWAFADNLAGTMSVFAAPDMPGMNMRNVHISGTVPLTAELKERVLCGTLDSLEPQDIEPYLRKHLKVGIRLASGKEVDVADVPSLHIHISSSGVLAPTSKDQLPTWDSTATSHFDLV